MYIYTILEQTTYLTISNLHIYVAVYPIHSATIRNQIIYFLYKQLLYNNHIYDIIYESEIINLAQFLNLIKEKYESINSIIGINVYDEMCKISSQIPVLNIALIENNYIELTENDNYGILPIFHAIFIENYEYFVLLFDMYIKHISKSFIFTHVILPIYSFIILDEKNKFHCDITIYIFGKIIFSSNFADKYPVAKNILAKNNIDPSLPDLETFMANLDI